MDEEFRENHADTLSRFYAAFESEHQYVIELNRLVEELEEGVHLQQSLESVMACEEGKQLMVQYIEIYLTLKLLLLEYYVFIKLMTMICYSVKPCICMELC